MGTKKTLKSIFVVILSNCSSIISGVLIGLLLPQIISVNDYGLYKTFTLYLTYAGFFSLGIIDGIVLDYGDKDYEDFNKPLFRSYWRWYFVIHLFFGITLLCAGTVINNLDYKFIFIMLSLNMMANNFTGYFQQLSQITQRFGEYSLRKTLQSAINIAIVVALYLTTKNGIDVTYKAYVVSIVLLNIVLTLWYIRTYKDIIFGKSLRYLDTYKNIIHLMKIGFPLLFANLCSTLILTLDRQFVNLLFDNTTYAIYAFSYNLLSLVTIATSAVSTVLYPILKRAEKGKLKDYYSHLIEVILVFVFMAMLIYFPLSVFIKCYLPKYEDSLSFFRIIFPGLAISTSITVVMHNYYKTLEKNIVYFKKSVIVLIFSAVANYLAYVVFKTPTAISIASIITMLLWYLFVEHYFVRIFSIKWKRNFIYLLVMMTGFYIITNISNFIVSGIIYAVFWLSVTLIFYRNTKQQIIRILIKQV